MAHGPHAKALPRRHTARGDPLAWVAVLALALALAGAIRLIPPLAMLESRARDVVHVAAYPRGGLSEDIVLVMIDEETLSGLAYRSPVDRAYLAMLIEALVARRPAAIGIDLLFGLARN